MSKKNIQALTIMDERFGHDTLISLATIDGVLFHNGKKYEIDFAKV